MKICRITIKLKETLEIIRYEIASNNEEILLKRLESLINENCLNTNIETINIEKLN